MAREATTEQHDVTLFTCRSRGLFHSGSEHKGANHLARLPTEDYQRSVPKVPLQRTHTVPKWDV